MMVWASRMAYSAVTCSLARSSACGSSGPARLIRLVLLERALELLHGGLGQDQGLVAQDVVDVEALDREPLRRVQVARAAHEVRVVLAVDDQHLVVRLRDA